MDGMKEGKIQEHLQMDRKTLEIMAPAGNFECLQAAIQGGADSVYPDENIKSISKAKAEAWLEENK